MSGENMLLGECAILLNLERERMRKYSGLESDIVIQDNSSRIEIFKDGLVRIYAGNQEELSRLFDVALISVCHAGGLAGYSLAMDRVTDLDTNEPPRMNYYGQGIGLSDRIDEAELRRTANTLLRTNRESLPFLVRSIQKLPTADEFSILSALTALELQLNRAVPDPNLQSFAKLEVLQYLSTHYEVLTQPEMQRLKKLNTLRNKLAHGTWIGDELGKAISNVLGGEPKDWLLGPGHTMSIDAARKLLEEVIDAIASLSAIEATHRLGTRDHTRASI